MPENTEPDILEALGLFLARTALLYALGHEQVLREDGSLPIDESDEEAKRILSLLKSQPIAESFCGPVVLSLRLLLTNKTHWQRANAAAGVRRLPGAPSRRRDVAAAFRGAAEVAVVGPLSAALRFRNGSTCPPAMCAKRRKANRTSRAPWAAVRDPTRKWAQTGMCTRGARKKRSPATSNPCDLPPQCAVARAILGALKLGNLDLRIRRQPGQCEQRRLECSAPSGVRRIAGARPQCLLRAKGRLPQCGARPGCDQIATVLI
jgi:hypothetical protein